MLFPLFFSMPQFFVQERVFNTSTERVCGYLKSVEGGKFTSESVKVIENGDFIGFDRFHARRLCDKKCVLS